MIGFFQVLSTNDYVDEVEEYIPGDLKTGDILLVSYSHFNGYLIRVWTRSLWTHPALVLVENGITYVLEASMYGWENGMLKLPFDVWVRYNKKHVLGSIRINKEIDSKKVSKYFNKLLDKDLDLFGPSWIRFLQNKPYEEIIMRKKIICVEAIVHILQRMNVIKKKISFSSFFPSDIAWGKFDCEDGYHYSKIKRLNVKNYYENCKPYLKKRN